MSKYFELGMYTEKQCNFTDQIINQIYYFDTMGRGSSYDIGTSTVYSVEGCIHITLTNIYVPF